MGGTFVVQDKDGLGGHECAQRVEGAERRTWGWDQILARAKNEVGRAGPLKGNYKIKIKWSDFLCKTVEGLDPFSIEPKEA